MDNPLRKQIKEELFKRDPGLSTHLELSEMNDKLENLTEELKKKEFEYQLELDRNDFIGLPGTPGEPGKDYILTEEDLDAIAKQIEVPVVEKVIEKTETIHEQPIVKEVAVGDTPEIIADKLNTLEGVIDVSVIKGSLTIDEIKSQFENWNQPAKGKLDQRWHGGGATKLTGLTDVSLSVPTNGQSLTYNSTTGKWTNSNSSGGGAWGSITGTITNQTDLITYLSTNYQPTGTYLTASTLSIVSDSPLSGAGTSASHLTITTDATHRWLTDTLATTWNGKQNAITTGTTAQYFRGDLSLATFPSIPSVGTWGALNYPTWASGTPFVKMTAAGTFALDTNTYLTTVTAHNLLSATHGDTLTDTVVAGDIMIGNATPKWSRLAKGTDGYVLTIDSTSHLPAWKVAAGSGWALNGNTIGAKKTLGSTDNYDIGFITNNTERMTILKTGYIGINKTAPTHALDIVGALDVRIPSQTGYNIHPVVFSSNDLSTYLTGYYTGDATLILGGRSDGSVPTLRLVQPNGGGWDTFGFEMNTSNLYGLGNGMGMALSGIGACPAGGYYSTWWGQNGYFGVNHTVVDDGNGVMKVNHTADDGSGAYLQVNGGVNIPSGQNYMIGGVPFGSSWTDAGGVIYPVNYATDTVLAGTNIKIPLTGGSTTTVADASSQSGTANEVQDAQMFGGSPDESTGNYNSTSQSYTIYAYGPGGFFSNSMGQGTNVSDYSGNNFQSQLSWYGGTGATGYIIYNTSSGYWIDVGNVTSFTDDGYFSGWTNGSPTISPTCNYSSTTIYYTLYTYATAPDSTQVFASSSGVGISAGDYMGVPFYNALSWSAGTGATGYILYNNSTGYYKDIGNVTSYNEGGDMTGWTYGAPTTAVISPYTVSAGNEAGVFQALGEIDATQDIKVTDQTGAYGIVLYDTVLASKVRVTSVGGVLTVTPF
jgi:hypothetical protein